jgi:hypothetical protein
MIAAANKIGHRGSEYLIERENIVAVPSENIRVDYGDIEGEDLESIRSGITVPLIGYINSEDGKFHTCDGFRRLAKYDFLTKDFEFEGYRIPCKIDMGCATEEGRILLALKLQGKAISMVESGYGYQRLIDLGRTVEEIATLAVKSVQAVTNALQLVNSDPSLINLVQSGDVSATTVIETVQSEGIEKAKEIIPLAIETAKIKGKKKATAPFIKQAKKQLELIDTEDYITDTDSDYYQTEEEEKTEIVAYLSNCDEEFWSGYNLTKLRKVMKLTK